MTAQKGELIKEAVRKMEEGRNVGPKCVNASNLFHKCNADCSPRAPGERRQTIEHSLGLLPCLLSSLFGMCSVTEHSKT